MSAVDDARRLGEDIVETVNQSSGFGVEFTGDDNTVYSPVVTDLVEKENSGDTTTRTDQCGNTRRNRTSNNGWMLQVEGIVTENEDRPGNLSTVVLDDVAVAGDIAVYSDIFSGILEVSNVIVTDDATTFTHVETEETWGKERAYTFSMELGEQDAEN